MTINYEKLMLVSISRILLLAILAFILALSGQLPGPGVSAQADTSILNSLSGSWENLDSYITLNLCAAAPTLGAKEAGVYQCSPSQLSLVSGNLFNASAFVSATDSVLNIADTLRKSEINSSDIKKLFSEFNYSEYLINTQVGYVGNGFTVGIRPLHWQGQFQFHNPNLPLGSLELRDDIEAFAGYGLGFEWESVHFGMGTQGTLVFREETLSEASLVDLAARSASELIEKQTQAGGFLDIGVFAEKRGWVSASLLFKDIGQFWSGQQLSGRTLFIKQDRTPKLFSAISFIPEIGVGSLQVGLEVISFLDQPNVLRDQWIGSLSYFVGPLRILSGFRPNLLRTGLGLKFSKFEVALAQEWINRLDDGRQAQPHLTLEMTAGL